MNTLLHRPGRTIAALLILISAASTARAQALVSNGGFEAGFAAVGACNGLEALNYLAEAKRVPSLILLDLMMPVLDGWTFCKLRQGIAMLMEIGHSIARAGVRKLILINSHGGNVPILDIVARDLRVDHDMLVVATGWMRFGLPELADLVVQSPQIQVRVGMIRLRGDRLHVGPSRLERRGLL